MAIPFVGTSATHIPGYYTVTLAFTPSDIFAIGAKYSIYGTSVGVASINDTSKTVTFTNLNGNLTFDFTSIYENCKVSGQASLIRVNTSYTNTIGIPTWLGGSVNTTAVYASSINTSRFATIFGKTMFSSISDANMVRHNDSLHSNILTSNMAQMSQSKYSSIIANIDSAIIRNGSQGSLILGGSGGVIDGAEGAVLIASRGSSGITGGNNNSVMASIVDTTGITNSSYSTIISAAGSSVINQSLNSSVYASGVQNVIGNARSSAILTSELISLSGTQNTALSSHWTHNLATRWSTVLSTYLSGINGGELNTLIGANDSYVYDGRGNAILNSHFAKIRLLSQYSTHVSTESSNIENSTRSVILSSYTSNIINANNSSILSASNSTNKGQNGILGSSRLTTILGNYNSAFSTESIEINGTGTSAISSSWIPGPSGTPTIRIDGTRFSVIASNIAATETSNAYESLIHSSNASYIRDSAEHALISSSSESAIKSSYNASISNSKYVGVLNSNTSAVSNSTTRIFDSDAAVADTYLIKSSTVSSISSSYKSYITGSDKASIISSWDSRITSSETGNSLISSNQMTISGGSWSVAIGSSNGSMNSSGAVMIGSYGSSMTNAFNSAIIASHTGSITNNAPHAVIFGSMSSSINGGGGSVGNGVYSSTGVSIGSGSNTESMNTAISAATTSITKSSYSHTTSSDNVEIVLSNRSTIIGSSYAKIGKADSSGIYNSQNAVVGDLINNTYGGGLNTSGNINDSGTKGVVIASSFCGVVGNSTDGRLYATVVNSSQFSYAIASEFSSITSSSFAQTKNSRQSVIVGSMGDGEGDFATYIRNSDHSGIYSSASSRIKNSINGTIGASWFSNLNYTSSSAVAGSFYCSNNSTTYTGINNSYMSHAHDAMTSIIAGAQYSSISNSALSILNGYNNHIGKATPAESVPVELTDRHSNAIIASTTGDLFNTHACVILGSTESSISPKATSIRDCQFEYNKGSTQVKIYLTSTSGVSVGQAIYIKNITKYLSNFAFNSANGTSTYSELDAFFTGNNNRIAGVVASIDNAYTLSVNVTQFGADGMYSYLTQAVPVTNTTDTKFAFKSIVEIYPNTTSSKNAIVASTGSKASGSNIAIIASNGVTADNMTYGALLGLTNSETVSGSGVHIGAAKFYSTINISNGKGLGKALVSDALGNATWQSVDTYCLGRSSVAAIATNTGIGMTMMGDGSTNAPRGFMPIVTHTASSSQHVTGVFVTQDTGNEIKIQLRFAASMPGSGLAPNGGNLLMEHAFTPTSATAGAQFSFLSTAEIPAGSILWLNVVDTVGQFANTQIGATIKA